MTYINGLGKNYVEEYKEFGEKILAESEQTLKKAGVSTPVFNAETENNMLEGYQMEHQDKTDNKKNDSIKKDDKNSNDTFESDEIMQNQTVMNVKSPDGVLNSLYKIVDVHPNGLAV